MIRYIGSKSVQEIMAMRRSRTTHRLEDRIVIVDSKDIMIREIINGRNIVSVRNTVTMIVP